MAVPPQDGEVHDTRHRFDRQLAGTSASAAALACDCDCPFIVHMNLQMSRLWGGPSARVQLICWDSMHSIVSLACYSCIQMTQMPRPTFLFVQLAGNSLGLYFVFLMPSQAIRFIRQPIARSLDLLANVAGSWLRFHLDANGDKLPWSVRL